MRLLSILCVFCVKPLQFSFLEHRSVVGKIILLCLRNETKVHQKPQVRTTNRKGTTSLSNTSCAHQFVPRSGTSRKANSTKKSPEKTPRYTTRYVFVVVFVKCTFCGASLYRFYALFWRLLSPDWIPALSSSSSSS